MNKFENIKTQPENGMERRQRIKNEIIIKVAAKLAEEDAEKRWEGRPIKEELQSHYDADRVKKSEEIKEILERVYEEYGDMILSASNPQEALEKLYFKENE
ncbi:MAG: hypothetical protein AAB366_00195 [Patescibacteria group bacterium]